jgi:hypothetical protein
MVASFLNDLTASVGLEVIKMETLTNDVLVTLDAPSSDFENALNEFDINFNSRTERDGTVLFFVSLEN